MPKPGEKKSDINRIQSGWPSCQLKMGKMKLQFTKLNNRKLESDLKKFRLAGGGVMVWKPKHFLSLSFVKNKVLLANTGYCIVSVNANIYQIC